MYTLQIRTGDAKTDFAWTDTNNVSELFHISSLLEGIDQECSGDARCISGTVSKVVDGNTIHLDGQSIRFALTSTPEMDTAKGIFARDFVVFFCPVGSAAIVDEDDGQTDGSYERILGVVYCNGLNLNEAVLEAGHGVISSEFCDTSEFADTSWAQKFGCTELIVESQSTCEGAGGMWGIWGNAEFTPETCNAATSDAGAQCSDSSQCQSFCQAEEGTEIDSETVGACYGYELAICMQEVRNGVAQAEWCQ